MSVIVTCSDRDDVARTVARQLRLSISDLQQDPARIVQLCLTGGRIANKMYQQLADDQGDDNTVDWRRVEFWWGDERFLPTESPDRNAGQTLALLAATIQFDPARTHAMPSAGGLCDLRQAATQYAQELGNTRFDICLLGVGEDGHVASIFPNHPSFEKPTSATVIGVTKSPKPPAERLSLTMDVINASSEVWIMAAGKEKREAVAKALGGNQSLPAGAVTGQRRTVWFLDADAASKIR